MKLIANLYDRRVAPLVAVVFAILFVMEGRRQLRKRRQPRFKRILINTVVALPAFTLFRLLFLPAMVWLARQSRRTGFGLNHCYAAHPAVKRAVAFLILDYTNYLWHILNHKLPLLWRFHLVHHTDPDLDLSTAIRFHFGELIGSVIYRGAFVFLSGASPADTLLYEGVFEAATQFHHSNWKLPYRFEKQLQYFIVTPRMHGIHHSIIRQETDSNYAVVFSIWDRFHGTARLNVAQQQIATGVPAYSHPDELTIGYLLKLPFGPIRPWQAPVAAHEAGASLPDKNQIAE
jgi:sterol desaturase/sphingolipid hydroxylase (fatty acid hydroxylase superfamily)